MAAILLDAKRDRYPPHRTHARRDSGYARRVSGLLCCPFCRELYTKDDEVERCPDCGVDLVPFYEVAPSPETRLEQEAMLDQTPPEWHTLSLWEWRRGRGLLLLLAILGLASYALPWFSQTMPETRVLTGYQLARHHVGWLWGGAVGWFILLPLVITRRSIAAMRGVRMIAAIFASMTATEILVFVNVTASRQSQVVVQFAWEWGIWVSCFISALGTCVAATFGGTIPQPRASETPVAAPVIESSQNRTRQPKARKRTLH